MLFIDPKSVNVQSVNQCVVSMGFASFDVVSLLNSKELCDCVFLPEHNLSYACAGFEQFHATPVDVRVTSIELSDMNSSDSAVRFTLTIAVTGKWNFSYCCESSQPEGFDEELVCGDSVQMQTFGMIEIAIELSNGTPPFHEFLIEYADHYAAITPVSFRGEYGTIVHNQ